MCGAMCQSISDRILLHAQQLSAINIREFYQKQQLLLHSVGSGPSSQSSLPILNQLITTTPSSPSSSISSRSTDIPLPLSIVPEGLLALSIPEDHSLLPSLSSTKKTKGLRPSHKHRLHTTYTINEHGERVYEIGSVTPDPYAERETKEDEIFVKRKEKEGEREEIVFR
jgi:hypothetical protein